MQKFPNRHRNHEIETLSKRYFEKCFPSSWVINYLNLDYGTDCNCEIVNNNQVTGVNFSVQLKGKETEPQKDYINIRIKRSTINRWLNKLEPTMIVAYIVDEKEAFWSWVENDSVDLTLQNATFAFKISRDNKLSKINWDIIKEYVGSIFSKRHLLYSLPVINSENKNVWNLYFEGKFTESLPLFYNLLKENPQDASILEAIAVTEYQLFNYSKALLYIRKAIEIEDNKGFYLNKASILTEQGHANKDDSKIKEAISIYKSLLVDGYITDSLYYNLGSASARLNNYDESIRYLREAVRINPNNSMYWNNLGNSYMNIGEHLLEMDCYDNALAINPEQPETLFSKGSTLFKYFKKADDGLILMLKSAQITDRYELDNPYFFFWISEAYLYKNDYKNSQIWNDKGLLFFGTDTYLLNQKMRITTKIGSVI